MNLKAWLVDECEVFAAPTAIEALAAHEEFFGCKAHLCELIDDSLMDTEFPLYDEDERPTTETTSIRRLLSEATETCWLASTVV